MNKKKALKTSLLAGCFLTLAALGLVFVMNAPAIDMPGFSGHDPITTVRVSRPENYQVVLNSF